MRKLIYILSGCLIALWLTSCNLFDCPFKEHIFISGSDVTRFQNDVVVSDKQENIYSGFEVGLFSTPGENPANTHTRITLWLDCIDTTDCTPISFFSIEINKDFTPGEPLELVTRTNSDLLQSGEAVIWVSLDDTDGVTYISGTVMVDTLDYIATGNTNSQGDLEYMVLLAMTINTSDKGDSPYLLNGHLEVEGAGFLSAEHCE